MNRHTFSVNQSFIPAFKRIATMVEISRVSAEAYPEMADYADNLVIQVITELLNIMDEKSKSIKAVDVYKAFENLGEDITVPFKLTSKEKKCRNIAKRPFERLLYEHLQNTSTSLLVDVKWSARTVDMMLVYVESKLIKLLKVAKQLTIHGKRSTLQIEDLVLARKMESEICIIK